jgi:2,3-bisphosphoglycerate-dependent phosphoglycerate mutase
MMRMSTLVLIRHGQSTWNLENRFTGWTDVPLTDRGEADAKLTGNLLKGKYTFDIAFTSRLKRANDTLAIVLQAMGTEVPTEYDSALNERHYGDLQGLNKAETAEKYGADQVKLWRRSYDTPPPNGESMADCERRTMPFFLQYVLPLVQSGKNVVIVAHGNSLRPIMKYLENLEKEAAASMEIGLVTPYVYTFEGKKSVKKEVLDVPGIQKTQDATKK